MRPFIFAFKFGEQLLMAPKVHTSALNTRVPKPVGEKARRH